MDLTRRDYLRAAGALALLGSTSLAGCTNPPVQTGPFLDVEPAYGDWFDGVPGYERTLDARGESAVDVTVGAQTSMGYFAFDPVAVGVSPGTTVTWTWAGKGGAHDVAADDGSFASELTDRAGTRFSHTFEAPGVYRYFCTPHRGMGMRGAVVVLA